MRVKGFTFVTALLLFPAIAHAQSTLTFARVMEPPEFATTGYAVVNPGAASAAVTFRLYGIHGQIVSTSPRTIPARGQFARLGSELFPNASAAGWVEATSTSTGLRGFWLSGDFKTFMDGADAAVPAAELVVPLVTPESELNIVNSSSGDLAVLMRVYGEGGTELGLSPVVQPIRAKGFFRAQISNLFPSTEVSARHIHLMCTMPFAASLIAKDFLTRPSRAVVNAVSPSTATRELNLPHVVHGRLGDVAYTGIVGITNLASSEQDVVLTFTPEDGSSPRSVQRTLRENGAIRSDLPSLFGLPNTFQNGSVRASGSLPIAGFIAYAEATASGVAVVTAQSEARAELLFAHIADLPPWLTGVALLNSSLLQSATVELFAMAPDGSLIGGAQNVSTARFLIPAGQKVAKLLSELIPQTQSRASASDGGFIFVRSDVPLYGLELFFSRDLQILSNVPAATIAPGITYTPPAPRP